MRAFGPEMVLEQPRLLLLLFLRETSAPVSCQARQLVEQRSELLLCRAVSGKGAVLQTIIHGWR